MPRGFGALMKHYDMIQKGSYFLEWAKCVLFYYLLLLFFLEPKWEKYNNLSIHECNY